MVPAMDRYRAEGTAADDRAAAGERCASRTTAWRPRFDGTAGSQLSREERERSGRLEAEQAGPDRKREEADRISPLHCSRTPATAGERGARGGELRQNRRELFYRVWLKWGKLAVLRFASPPRYAKDAPSWGPDFASVGMTILLRWKGVSR